jgi:hypothetical protein
MDKIKVVGYLSKANWGGRYQPREQDFVIDADGICMSIPSSYTRHPFKILIDENI